MHLFSIPYVGFLCKAHHTSVFALELLEGSLLISSFSHVGCGPYMNCSFLEMDQGMTSPDKLLIFQTCHWFVLWPWVSSVHLHGCGRWGGDIDVLWELFQHLLMTMVGFFSSDMPGFMHGPTKLAELRFTGVWRRSAKCQFDACFEKCSRKSCFYLTWVSNELTRENFKMQFVPSTSSAWKCLLWAANCISAILSFLVETLVLQWRVSNTRSLSRPLMILWRVMV